MLGDTVVRALDDVSLEIEDKSFTAIMGPSGSGKSTLMSLIGCLDVPTSGIIKIDGEELRGMTEEDLAYIRNRKIGFVFQHFSLLPKLSALDNAALPLLYAGVSLRERRERAEEMLCRVGLSDRMKHRPSELSGGQKQRIAIFKMSSDPFPAITFSYVIPNAAPISARSSVASGSGYRRSRP